ncbi:Nif3-like dinuclear metal center hexameric protein [Motilibacter aurantiacus]|uniref:Nif3-like dinuclear metal center hexameric protein n=1 Tax=Motilibacter aurantiacus TaxID=2714955 RepID=UPI001407D1B3|nr:Nif3-like dinuclear metal center hexameric protein [Motilibacter aurantiacus]
MATTPTLAQVTAALEELYDPSWAEPWDAVGLVCGDPDAPVRRVLFAVDPVEATAAEAARGGYDLLVTHHPLYLRGTSSVAATTPKGRVVHGLVRNGVGLHVAHTNADVADPGVSDALATAIGLTGLRPLDPRPADPLDKIVTFVPTPDAERVVDALAAAGAGAIGDYTRCAFLGHGTGTFLPGPGAQPAIGQVGTAEHVAETRLEMVLPRGRRAEVVRALRAAHPYEEPAFDVLELALPPGPRGIGRVGTLPEAEPLAQFVRRVAGALPAAPVGIRAAGDPDAPVRTVAVCGGSGDSLLAAARRSGADAYVTADLRHHPVSDERAEGRLALVDAGHWASEWPWLADAAARLRAALAANGTTVETAVSRAVTDPWALHVPSPHS